MQLLSIPIYDQLQAEAGAGGFTLIEDLGLYTGNIVNLLLIAAGTATFVYLVLGGISWITAGSDQSKVDDARNRITNAIIGLAIVAGSWALFTLLDYFFGLGLVSMTPQLTLPHPILFC